MLLQNRGQIAKIELLYQDFELADALRIACELNIDITKVEPWLRVYYDTISYWGVGYLATEWKPAVIHSLAVLIAETVENDENLWTWETLPEGAKELYDRDLAIWQENWAKIY